MKPHRDKDFADFYNQLITDKEQLSADTFGFQSKHNAVYRSWLEHSPLPTLDGRPYPYGFLPIRFYKHHLVSSVPNENPEIIFESSGTSGQTPSRKPLYRTDFYKENSIDIFNRSFGLDLSKYRILALLPNYLERGNSSLVHMVQDWMSLSPDMEHGFYLRDYDRLVDMLHQDTPTLLIGVTYALIDLAPLIKEPLQDTLVIETGGMKGRAQNWIKSELHAYLREGLGCDIYSEYGMTELMSQAYTSGRQVFKPPAQMSILVRDETDPLSLSSSGRGALNIIDLANQDTVSFIATDDVGYVHDDGSFEILGRLDQSEARGCSQLYFM